MPLRFVFKIDGHEKFACDLRCQRCEAIKANGQQCGMRSCMGVPYCWIHLAKEKHLRIKPSTLPNAGNGLFVVGEPNSVVFKRGDVILQYFGDHIDETELVRRYGDKTAIYAVENTHVGYVDPACYRGAAALANEKPKRQTNASLAIIDDGPVVIVAKKNIHAGEEIFVNYGSDYVYDEDVTYGTTRTRRPKGNEYF